MDLLPHQQVLEGFVFPTPLQLCACLALGCRWGCAVCCLLHPSRLACLSVCPPTSILLCVHVSVQHGLSLVSFPCPRSSGLCLESQEGVAGQCWGSPQQHSQYCFLAAWLWLLDGGTNLDGEFDLGLAFPKQAGSQVEPQSCPWKQFQSCTKELDADFAVTVRVGCSPHHLWVSCRQGATFVAVFD